MPTRSPLPFLLCSAILLAGCSKPKIESQVDVPTTLAGVRALADPPRVTVTVEQVKRYPIRPGSGGGFRCGHPVCLIAVPFLLWELAFPTMIDVVNVTEGGVITYSGMFKPKGDFIQARVRRGKVVRDLRLLELKELRKRLVVEVARATVGQDGKLGEFTPTPFATQVKLLDAYRAAMDKPPLFSSKKDVLKEAIAWLDEGALPLLEERVKDPKEEDEIKDLALTPCHAPLLKLAQSVTLGPRALDTAINCYTGAWTKSPRLVKDDGVLVFFDLLLDRFCKSKSYVGGLEAHLGRDSKRGPELRRRAAAVKRCSTPGRLILLRDFAGEPVTEAEYSAALAEKDGTAQALLDLFDLRIGPQASHPRIAVMRPVVFKALRSGRVRLVNDHEKVSREELVLRVDRISYGKFSREELVVIAELYLRPAAAGERGVSRDACLKIFHGQPHLNAEPLAVVKAMIEAALQKAPEKDRPYLTLALFVLGDHEQARQLVKVIALESPKPQADGKLSAAQVEHVQLAALVQNWLERVLRCDPYEFRREVRRAATPAQPDDGKFCGVTLGKPASRPTR